MTAITIRMADIAALAQFMPAILVHSGAAQARVLLALPPLLRDGQHSWFFRAMLYEDNTAMPEIPDLAGIMVTHVR